MTKLVAKTEQGELVGKLSKDYKGGEFISFLGVPYARPPIGPLRFLDPQPPESWKGTRDATKPGQNCYGWDIHISSEGLTTKPGGSEDCLVLNIFTHELNKDVAEPKPVMVFIPGGAFTAGSANPQTYGPEILMTSDVVLVTVNYRTGALGFLSIDDSEIGNAGLKDIVQSLKWIKQNIHAFGGDPNNVTIFGESAGAAAVQFLVLSPSAKGLFHKAICQSGSVLNCWSRGTNNNHLALAKAMGFSGTDKEDVLKFLQGQPVAKIFEAQKQLKDHFNAGVPRLFCPVIEKDSPNAFLSEDPIDLIHTGKYNHVPFMMGYNSHDGLIMYALEQINCTYCLENRVPHFLGYSEDNKVAQEINKEINRFYFGRAKYDDNNEEAKVFLSTDNFFVRGINTSVKQHVKTSTAPVYYYKVTAVTDISMARKLEAPGPAHGDELLYLFTNPTLPKLKPDTIENTLSMRFVKLWTNFAQCGNPTPEKDPLLLNVEWRPATKEKLNFLDIGRRFRTMTDPDGARLRIWDKAFDTLSEKY